MKRCGGAFAALAALAALAAACTSEEARGDHCERVLAKLDDCAGTRLARIDCSAVSTADLNRFDDLGQGLACQALQGVVPTDGDPLSATCRLLGVGCVAAVTPVPTRTPARYPVLLVNGIDTSPLFRYSTRIVSTMRETGGHQVYLATLTPYETTRVRTPELWKRIGEVLAETGATKVNLICHSLGGLDCRYLVSPAGLAADLDVSRGTMAARVASITTIGTAHRGTRVADVLLGALPDGDRGALVNDFATLAGDAFAPARIDGDVHLRDALRALSVAAAPAFNDEITNAEGVLYQSGGPCRMLRASIRSRTSSTPSRRATTSSSASSCRAPPARSTPRISPAFAPPPPRSRCSAGVSSRATAALPR